MQVKHTINNNHGHQSLAPVQGCLVLTGPLTGVLGVYMPSCALHGLHRSEQSAEIPLWCPVGVFARNRDSHPHPQQHRGICPSMPSTHLHGKHALLRFVVLNLKSIHRCCGVLKLGLHARRAKEFHPQLEAMLWYRDKFSQADHSVQRARSTHKIGPSKNATHQQTSYSPRC